MTSKVWGGIDMNPALTPDDGPCLCGRTSMVYPIYYGGPTIHVAGCPAADSNRVFAVVESPKRKRIILSSGEEWKPARRAKSYSHALRRSDKTNYRLLLQFFFERPITIELWKKIKAPPGWRKCPTSKDAQKEYYGVRFTCRDLKHSLTPEQVETLRASLCALCQQAHSQRR